MNIYKIQHDLFILHLFAHVVILYFSLFAKNVSLKAQQQQQKRLDKFTL